MKEKTNELTTLAVASHKEVSLMPSVSRGSQQDNSEALHKSPGPFATAVSFLNPSAWGHLNPSSYCDVGRLFYGVFKLWSKLQREKK
jgi:hypothetical protein